MAAFACRILPFCGPLLVGAQTRSSIPRGSADQKFSVIGIHPIFIVGLVHDGPRWRC